MSGDGHQWKYCPLCGNALSEDGVCETCVAVPLIRSAEPKVERESNTGTRIILGMGMGCWRPSSG